MQWRTDFENATEPDCILLTKYGLIVSGNWRKRTFCWWVHGGDALYKNQLVGWLPRAALPPAPNTADDIQ